ncbi:MAG: pilin [Gammaproteobacteria bacterium]|nr:pilin [Gammaproteobacteria bacterium]
MASKRESGPAGFTLIEIMVAVAIIGILAAIATPLYLRFTARAQSSEALSLVSAFKPAVTLYFHRHHSFVGATNAILGMPSARSFNGQYVGLVQVGAVSAQTLDITAKFCSETYDPDCHISDELSGHTLYLSAFVGDHGNAPTIQWVCWVNEESQYPYIPASCRHTHRRP